jgi:hypothetical protein
MAIPTGRLRTSLRIAALAAIVFAVLVTRVMTSASEELRNADRRLAAGDIDGSIVHYRRAARWYAPGSPFHVQALAKLAALGARAERRGETDRALTAYRAIRSAIMSARSFYTPEPKRLGFADRKIAELMASLPPPPIDAGKSREQLRAEHLALLESSRGPDILWTWVLLLGFMSWIAGAYAFTIRAIDDQDRLVWSEVRRWGAVIVIGFGLFVLGMTLA